MKAAWFAIALISAIAVSKEACSQTSVVMTLGSRHMGGGHYCETNPGLGLEDGGTFRRIVGFYKNSLCRTSVYMGSTYQPLRYGPVRLGGVVLAVTGYEDPVTLGAGLTLTYTDAVNVIWLPNKKGEFQNGVIGVQLVRRW